MRLRRRSPGSLTSSAERHVVIFSIFTTRRDRNFFNLLAASRGFTGLARGTRLALWPRPWTRWNSIRSSRGPGIPISSRASTTTATAAVNAARSPSAASSIWRRVASMRWRETKTSKKTTRWAGPWRDHSSAASTCSASSGTGWASTLSATRPSQQSPLRPLIPINSQAPAQSCRRRTIRMRRRKRRTTRCCGCRASTRIWPGQSCARSAPSFTCGAKQRWWTRAKRSNCSPRASPPRCSGRS